MNNAVYGNRMENLGNRIVLKLVNDEKDYLKWTSILSKNIHNKKYHHKKYSIMI